LGIRAQWQRLRVLGDVLGLGLVVWGMGSRGCGLLLGGLGAGCELCGHVGDVERAVRVEWERGARGGAKRGGDRLQLVRRGRERRGGR
jgi:hypothetical protein